VKKINIATNTTTKTITYKYFDDGNIKSMNISDVDGYVQEIIFVYENGELISYLGHKTGPNNLLHDETNVINYNNLEQIVKICIVSEDNFYGTKVGRMEFEYSEEGNLIEYVRYNSENSEFYNCDNIESIYFKELYEFDNGNIIRSESDGTIFTGTYKNYIYDDENNPYENIRPLALRKILLYSKNNISELTHFKSENNEIIGQTIYTYEYNDDEYPTLSTKSFSSDGKSQTTKIEYEYY